MQDRPFSDISFESYLNEEKLMGSRCSGCRTLYLPPRPICTACRGSQMRWEQVSGKGRLAAFTCISIAPPAMIAEGYNRHNPYISGVVELEEGTRVDARIEGIDPRKPEEIRIGMPLKVRFLHRGEHRTYLAFDPA
ncbi:MAG: hypothetical protein AMJ54_07940 [Deltaproteobacteria bacterium SG8_13]|nr:MAG: hypothetical protein AMJ54_07940 [Deltaproteobacteria bacterium SG8_13]